MGKFDDIRWKWLEERGLQVKGDPYQLDYVLSLWKHPDMTKAIFCEGKAGTGKTHTAVLAGAYEIETGFYTRIRYVRNAVPVRDQGFVKGDNDAKDAPYLQPFKDALDLVRPATYEKWVEEGKAIAHTTSYIRGTTWTNEFIILDEIQNWDLHEIQTALTRVGRGSKVVITGSYRQVDNKKIKLIKNLLPYQIYMIHFEGDSRVAFHTLYTCHRDWLADKADDIHETVQRIQGEI